MKIATLGTGGIGGFLAVKLILGGFQVVTIARGQHLKAIKENGLVLNGPSEHLVASPWFATEETKEVGKVDAIILGVKGNNLDEAALACLPMIGENTLVVPFLNGVEARERLIKIIPAKHVAKGVAQVSTTISKPGTIKQTGEINKFIFAEYDNNPSDRIKTLQKAIQSSGSNAPETNDIDRELWNKFIFFSALSGVTAAARCTIKEITQIEPLSKLYKGVLAETASIARARKIPIAPTIEEDTWSILQNLPKDIRASTAIDLENKKPLEIDWISGAVKRLAKEAGVSAPINAVLYALLLPYRDGNK